MNNLQLGLAEKSLKSIMEQYTKSLSITTVFLCVDNDKAGDEAYEKLVLFAEKCEQVIRLKPATLSLKLFSHNRPDGSLSAFWENVAD